MPFVLDSLKNCFLLPGISFQMYSEANQPSIWIDGIRTDWSKWIMLFPHRRAIYIEHWIVFMPLGSSEDCIVCWPFNKLMWYKVQSRMGNFLQNGDWMRLAWCLILINRATRRLQTYFYMSTENMEAIHNMVTMSVTSCTQQFKCALVPNHIH